MGDGRFQAVADLETGDLVYGTEPGRPGRDIRRRYVPAVVSGIRADAQRVYRLRFGDGTLIDVGADQLFLTYRGWKYVTGSEQGHARRPHLTLGSIARGTGRFSPGPEDTDAYRRGYLCGLIRGDGHVAAYVCGGAGRTRSIKYGFRLALADTEALDRADAYLKEAGIEVRRFLFQAEKPGYRPLWALGNQSRAGVTRIERLIAWPVTPCDGWRAGFLAGIFDAEGSCAAHEALRIANSDPEILEWTETCLRRFGFDIVSESTEGRHGMSYIRLRGGHKEKLRFSHLTDPTISRKRAIEGLALQSAADLRLVAIERLPQVAVLFHVTTATEDMVVNGLVAGAVRDAVCRAFPRDRREISA